MALTTRTAALTGALACVSLVFASGAHAERHYDCTKAGNANKAVCKTAAVAAPTPATPTGAMAPASATTRHHDCTKAGNANKAACKTGTATAPAPATTTATAAAPAPAAKPSIFSRMTKRTQPAAAPMPAAKPAATTTVAAAPGGSYGGKSITASPAGATGQCRDGTFTHATHHSGACSSHGGVAKWM